MVKIDKSLLIDITNSAFIWKPVRAPSNRDDGGLLPDAYLTSSEKRATNGENIKGPLLAVIRSPLKKALDIDIAPLFGSLSALPQIAMMAAYYLMPI